MSERRVIAEYMRNGDKYCVEHNSDCYGNYYAIHCLGDDSLGNPSWFNCAQFRKDAIELERKLQNEDKRPDPIDRKYKTEIAKNESLFYHIVSVLVDSQKMREKRESEESFLRFKEALQRIINIDEESGLNPLDDKECRSKMAIVVRGAVKNE
jgi:hypothetical protein